MPTAAVNTANTASSNATAAVNTANTASSNATAAVNTANTASSNATTAVNTANAATTTANAASAAVANAVLYDPVANVAAIPGSPSNNDYVEVQDSTGIESFTPLSGLPSGFVGDSGLVVRLKYVTSPSTTWQWQNYFAKDSETRYLKDNAAQIVDADINASAAIGLSKLATGALPTAITVTSANISDLSIVNADVNASAAIAGTKISPDFGSQAITTTGAGTFGGNVGVGTTSASTKLHVNGTTPTMRVSHGTSQVVELKADSSASILRTTTNHPLLFGTNDTERLRIDSSGTVSVGSSAVSGVGVHLRPFGNVVSRRASGALQVFEGYQGSTLTSEIKADGSADFTGTLVSKNRININNTTTTASDIVHSINTGSTLTTTQRTKADGTIQLGSVNGNSDTANIVLNADGSATFANNVAVGATDLTQGRLFVTNTPTTSTENLIVLGDGNGLKTFLKSNGSATFASSVGIGTTSPGGKLSVFDSSSAVFRLETPGVIAISHTFDGTNYTINNNDGSSGHPIIFGTKTAGAESMRIDSSGRLLIGHSSSVDSNSALQVIGRNTITAIRYSAATGNAGSKLELSRSASNTVGTTAAVAATDELGEVRFRGATSSSTFNTGAVIAARVESGTISSSSLPTALLFSTTANGSASSTERLRIDSSGNVAIGRNSASSELDIQAASGRTQITLRNVGNTSDASTFVAAEEMTSGNADLLLAGRHSVRFLSNLGEKMRINSGGNVGINRTDPDQRLNVNGNIEVNAYDGTSGSGGYYTSKGLIVGNAYDAGKSAGDDRNGIIWQERGLDLVFATTDTERLRIDSSGNVGIGETNPATKLHLKLDTNKHIRFQGNIGEIGSVPGFQGVTDAGALTGLGMRGSDLRFATGSSERMRIDGSGRLLQGKTSTKGSFGENVPTYCTEIVSSNPNVLEIANNGTGTNSYSALVLSRSDGGSVNSHTAVDSGDKIGEVCFIGADGSDRFNGAASINAVAAADFTANNCPAHLIFKTNGGSASLSERMRIDSSGRLLLGTTTEGYSDADDFTVANSGNCGITIRSGTTNAGAIYFSDGTSGNAEYQGYIEYSQNSGFLRFGSAAAERMRIDSSGDVLINNTTGSVSDAGSITLRPDGNGTNQPFVGCGGNTSSNTDVTYGVYSTSLNQYQFYVGYGGTVYARSTSISSLSDEREKENIRDLDTGLAQILQLQPRRFDWKNGSGQDVAGFVAQEVETVLPELVDEYMLTETETRKALKMGDLVPTLVKALQETHAKIETLETKVAALEAA